MRIGIGVAALLLAPLAGFAQPAAGAREAFLKVCGGCHSVETVTSQRRTRAQWQESINSMIARGAKGTDQEFSLILDYLAASIRSGIARRTQRRTSSRRAGTRPRPFPRARPISR